MNRNLLERARRQRASWLLRRCLAGDQVDIVCLHLGKARVFHMPGQLFVDYQLATAKIRPDLLEGMAAYGGYAPLYIGTKAAYSEGGYEAGPHASLVAPSAEKPLMDTIKRLLEK